MKRHALGALILATLAGCGDGGTSARPLPQTAPSVGQSPRHRPPSLGARAARGLPIRGLRCTRDPSAARFGIHLELFAAKRVVLIPPGIGIAPPRKQTGAYVRGGRCSYPLRTREPTGVIEVQATRRAKTLGQLFAIWGQPLSRTRLAGFRGPLQAYVDGRRWPGAPGAIPLTRHAQIVLETGGYITPHTSYRFPPGL